MSGSCHIVCLFSKKRKKARKIPKADPVIRLAYHMKRQGKSPSFTFFLYIKKAPGATRIQFLNEGHSVFSHLKTAKEIKGLRKNFICIHGNSLSFLFYTSASALLYTSWGILSMINNILDTYGLFFSAFLGYSTLFSDSTISIFFSLKYIIPLMIKENSTVNSRLYR